MPAAPSIFDYFAEVADPRIDRTKRHLLLDIITITICAVICGAETWEDIEEYGHSKHEWLASFLELPHGIPSHDTISRVFTRLKPKQFQHCFLNWVGAVQRTSAGRLVAIDGKQARGSADRQAGRAAIHTVSAWASANHLVLGQVKVDDKSNEITAIPELLAMLEIEGSTVTIDAMGCQTQIANQIVDQGADYVLAVKGNQGILHEEIREYFAWASSKAHATHLKEGAHSRHQTIDGDHGRIETRRYWITDDVEWLTNGEQWRELQTIGMVECERIVGEHRSLETRYYISSLGAEAKRFGEAVRGHWGIENSLHWVLDVTFGEDASRIRKDHAPANMTIMRHIAVNLLKQEKTSKRSMAGKRKKAGWDDAYLLKVLNI